VYLFHHNGQLSIEEFHLPFGNKLDPNNRWVLLSAIIPWGELEEKYAHLFNAKTGAPAKLSPSGWPLVLSISSRGLALQIERLWN
jgi:hypothetical protein